LIAKNIAREKEEMLWTKAAELLDKEELRDRIDMFTILILGGCGIVRAEISRESLVNIVGIGPGSSSKLTFEAAKLLRSSAKIFGAKRYLHAIADIAQGEKITHQGSCAKRMTLRLQEARAASQQGKQTSILTGGDPSIFSSAWRIVHDEGGFSPHICSGISAFSAVAARAGAPLINDHIVLSDAKNNSIIASMVRAGFGIVAYNLASQDLSSLLQEIDPSHPCALARDVARDGETIFVDNASDILESTPVGTRFTLIVASANSYIKDGKIISRRGYQNKYIY